MGTHPRQQGPDGVTVTNHHSVDAADLPGLRADPESARRAHQRESGFGTGRGDFQRTRSARFGERAMRQEGAPPGCLTIAEPTSNDGRRQAAHRTPTAIHDPGLFRQSLATLRYPDHISGSFADAAGLNHRHFAVVTVDVEDVFAQASGRCAGINLDFDDDRTTDDMQGTTETQQRRHFRFAAACFRHFDAAQLILDRRRHRHGRASSRHRTRTVSKTCANFPGSCRSPVAETSANVTLHPHDAHADTTSSLPAPSRMWVESAIT